MIERVGFDEGNITVEYNLAPKMVVFSHDFAVLRDDRGLLNDIAGHLPHGYGYVLFDYYDIDLKGENIQIKTFAEQMKRLSAVMDWVQQKAGVEEVNLVAHSLGCIVAAKLNPKKVRKLLLLAPPTVVGNDLKHYSEAAGAVEHDGIWKLKRSENVTINIPDSFFTEMKRIDADAELSELALMRDYTIILPGTEEVFEDPDYTELIMAPKVHAELVDETNHYFEGTGRPKLLEVINNLLIAQ